MCTLTNVSSSKLGARDSSVSSNDTVGPTPPLFSHLYPISMRWVVSEPEPRPHESISISIALTLYSKSRPPRHAAIPHANLKLTSRKTGSNNYCASKKRKFQRFAVTMKKRFLCKTNENTLKWDNVYNKFVLKSLDFHKRKHKEEDKLWTWTSYDILNSVISSCIDGGDYSVITAVGSLSSPVCITWWQLSSGIKVHFKKNLWIILFIWNKMMVFMTNACGMLFDMLY